MQRSWHPSVRLSIPDRDKESISPLRRPHRNKVPFKWPKWAVPEGVKRPGREIDHLPHPAPRLRMSGIMHFHEVHRINVTVIPYCNYQNNEANPKITHITHYHICDQVISAASNTTKKHYIQLDCTIWRNVAVWFLSIYSCFYDKMNVPNWWLWHRFIWADFKNPVISSRF